jgi:hypothetical protein
MDFEGTSTALGRGTSNFEVSKHQDALHGYSTDFKQ